VELSALSTDLISALPKVAENQAPPSMGEDVVAFHALLSAVKQDFALLIPADAAKASGKNLPAARQAATDDAADGDGMIDAGPGDGTAGEYEEDNSIWLPPTMATTAAAVATPSHATGLPVLPAADHPVAQTEPDDPRVTARPVEALAEAGDAPRRGVGARQATTDAAIPAAVTPDVTIDATAVHRTAGQPVDDIATTAVKPRPNSTGGEIDPAPIGEPGAGTQPVRPAPQPQANRIDSTTAAIIAPAAPAAVAPRPTGPVGAPVVPTPAAELPAAAPLRMTPQPQPTDGMEAAPIAPATPGAASPVDTQPAQARTREDAGGVAPLPRTDGPQPASPGPAVVTNPATPAGTVAAPVPPTAPTANPATPVQGVAPPAASPVTLPAPPEPVVRVVTERGLGDRLHADPALPTTFTRSAPAADRLADPAAATLETPAGSPAPAPGPATQRSADIATAMVTPQTMRGEPVALPAAADASTSTPAPAIATGMAVAAPAPALATPLPQAVAQAMPSIDTSRADWIATLVDRIDEARGADGARSTQMKLRPDALGMLEVRIRIDGEQTHVSFRTDNPAAHALITEATQRLADMAEARGLKLGQTQVDLSSGNPGGQRRDGPAAEERQRPNLANLKHQPAGNDSAPMTRERLA
jgi:hypothetical protein